MALKRIDKTKIANKTPSLVPEGKSLNDYANIGLIGVGTALSTSANLLAGFQVSEIADFNVGQIGNQITDLGIASDLNIKQFERSARELIGKQKTAAATSGFITSGSIASVMADTLAQIEIEKLTRLESARSKRAALESQQAITRYQGEQAQLGSFLQAGASAAKGIHGLLEVL